MIEKELTKRENEIFAIVNKVEEREITKQEGIQKLRKIGRGLKAYVKNFSFTELDKNHKQVLLKEVKRTMNKISYFCNTWEYINKTDVESVIELTKK